MVASYQPDDARFTLEALRYLAAPAGASLRAAALATEASPAAIARLRRAHPADAVHAALTMAAIQPKARAKFPSFFAGADAWFYAPPEALEQASSERVARHKAARFARRSAQLSLAPPRAILDLCAGIGGDTLGLAQIAPTLAVDVSAVRLWCARQNALAFRPPFPLLHVRADVAALPVAPAADLSFHLDPARRSAGTRSHAYADLIPPPPVIERILAAFPRGGALKLSPGVDFATLPPGHLELISERGTVVQAVLWTGRLAAALGPPTQRTATIVDAGFSFTATPGSPPGPAPVQSYLYEIDPALHRAGLAPALAATLALAPANLDAGYLTGPTLLDHPALVPFRPLQTLPYSEKRLAAALRELLTSGLAAGPVEVKTRGGLKLDTDALQRTFRKLTSSAVTVLIYPTDTGTFATLAARLATRQNVPMAE